MSSAALVAKLANFRGPMVGIRVRNTPGFIYNRLGAPVGLYMAYLLD